MKKTFYILLLSFTFPLIGLTQENNFIKPTKENTNIKNQFDLDIEVMAVSFGYKHKIYKNWFLGGEVGIGPLASYIYTWDNPPYHGFGYTDFFHLSFAAKRQTKKTLWSYEIESRYGIFSLEDGQYALSVGAGFYYGRKFQVGVNFFGGRRYEVGLPYFISNNIILRINTKW